MKIAITGAATLAADQITSCDDVPMGRLSEEKRTLIATLRQSNAKQAGVVSVLV